MEKRNGVPFWMSAAIFVLCVLSLAGDVYALVSGRIFKLVNIANALCALIYCFIGYRKNGAIFYKAYCIQHLITTVVLMCGFRQYFAQSGIMPAVIMLLALAIICSQCIMAFVKDLGRRKSMILAIVILLAKIAMVTIAVVGKAATIGIVYEPIIIAFVFCLMVYGKYQDKAARGTT